ncbi:hypothetical protein EYZ11_001460 [Aspergillus tanneri]|uniref:Uncharacterized protein n=1 Tax=Aspergillus tanneri TaxID=1220188 RepID=A0A4S3JUJ2_9EURO|nr:hypothetical protein EYZ11_001460 [Aspergillus tanneri]
MPHFTNEPEPSPTTLSGSETAIETSSAVHPPVSGGAGAAPDSSEGALSKEEVNRLYEERMEEEYAKREGGA